MINIFFNRWGRFLKMPVNLFLLSFCFLNFSCSKNWLNEKSDKNLAVPETLRDFESLLDNSAIMNVNSVCLGEIAADGKTMPGGRWEGVIDDAARNAYTWTYNYSYNNLWDWQKQYQKIFYCNIVIDGMESMDMSVAMSAEGKEIKGNALFHRAFNLYDLSQIWAPCYDGSAENNSLGVPVKISSDINIPTVRATVKETYNRIIADLSVAAQLLPVNARYKTRGSKPAAFALLARTYLSMGNFEAAKKYADSCLHYKNGLLNFNGLSTTAAFPFALFNDEVLFHTTMINNMSSVASGWIVPLTFYNEYHENDLRKKLYFTNTNGVVAFKGSYYGGVRLLFSGLAIDEVYLIRAESLARLGMLNEALLDLNTLLESRWDATVTYPVIVYNNATDAVDRIIEERKKELFWRGTRWTDLRRFDQEGRLKKTFSRTAGGQVYELEPGSYKYSFPIPNDIIAINGIAQNEGWVK